MYQKEVQDMNSKMFGHCYLKNICNKVFFIIKPSPKLTWLRQSGWGRAGLETSVALGRPSLGRVGRRTEMQP